MHGRKVVKGMMLNRILMVLGLAILVAGCATPLTTREQGALAGGAIGAGAGAAIGSTTGHTGTGALIGAGVGALSGALIGDAMQANEQRQAAAPPAVPPAAAPPPPASVVVAPPPPQNLTVGINIGSPPQFAVVPGTPVYYAPSVPYNYFFYGGQYYLFHNEVWFSAAYYNGPWTVIALERVPQPILVVPVNYYRVPPGHWKTRSGPPPWAPAKGYGKNKKKWDDD